MKRTLFLRVMWASSYSGSFSISLSSSRIFLLFFAVSFFTFTPHQLIYKDTHPDTARPKILWTMFAIFLVVRANISAFHVFEYDFWLQFSVFVCNCWVCVSVLLPHIGDPEHKMLTILNIYDSWRQTAYRFAIEQWAKDGCSDGKMY